MLASPAGLHGKWWRICTARARTNDLAAKFTPEEIVSNLATLHRTAHVKGVRTVAFTIPESAASKHVDWLGELRNLANDAIRKWVQTLPKERTMLVESAELLPYSPGRMWEPDGLHMSKYGYEEFGRKLAPIIKDFVNDG
mmetsp:Transcript_26442/g.39864  ORF Transcript_26442/g.39864 Transcript_26442/m.39864 type:complete len:140 (+) Transcript_26442:131-550(+)